MRKCIFMDNDRWCLGGIWFDYDGVSRRNTVLWIMIKCVQEEYYVMAYDRMCPGSIWFIGC